MIETFIQQIKQRQAEISLGAMQRPSTEQGLTMLTAGRWQGLQEALDILEYVIRDQEED